MTLTVGSLFSGIGGLELGLERAGMKTVWQVEIDEPCTSVLANHWPTVPRFGDICDVGPDQLARPDVICGGFPCQDVSVAGRRAGLAGERSGLWHEFARIIGALAPRVVLIENVPGLLSSHEGRDFALIVRGLVELGYGVSWRVLDSQYFGVPQRRRRVFVVGHLGGVPRPEVLFEPSSVSGDLAPRLEEGEATARDVAACLNSGGNNGGFRTEPGSHLVGEDGPYWDGGDRVDCLDSSQLGEGPDDARQATVPGRHEPRTGPRPARQSAGARVPTVSSSEHKGHTVVFAKGRRSQDAEAPETWKESETAPTIAGHGTKSGTIAFKPSHYTRGKEGTGPLDSSTVKAVTAGAPRRLTPMECERLQGFPDGWSAGQSDSARYRQLGNAVSVPVAEWIGRRILEHAKA